MKLTILKNIKHSTFFAAFSALSLLISLVLNTTLTSNVNAQNNNDVIKEIINKNFLKKFQSKPTKSVNKQVPQNLQAVNYSFAPIVKKTVPAVVNILAKRVIESDVTYRPLFDDPFFKKFFNSPNRNRKRTSISKSLGSGVIVNPNGIIVTNYHVIKNSSEITIINKENNEFEAEIIATDEQSDLAVIKIINHDRNKKFPYIKFAEPDSLEVGDLVLAIGNPFGVGQTVTSGIVSALSRTKTGISDYGFFIQTDAAINPGNSGGALVDIHGNLVGINSAIFTTSKKGGSLGIGFAIPIDMVDFVVKSALNEGSIKRPWIGAKLQEVDSDIAQALGLSKTFGVLIKDINKDGTLSKSDLRVGDVILAVNGHEIYDEATLNYRLVTVGIGNLAKIKILRRGRARYIDLIVEDMPDAYDTKVYTLKGNSIFSGLSVSNLNPIISEKLKISYDISGVVVISAGRSSRSIFGSNFKKNDVLLEVNNEEIEDVNHLLEIANSGAKSWNIIILRKGKLYNIRQYGK